MKMWKLAGSAAALALIAANPVLADVTPEDVWQSWQDVMATSGSTVTTGSVERDGDTLIVTDVKAAFDGDEGKGETTISEIRLRDRGDGTVEVILAEEASFTSASPGIDGGKPFGASGTVKMPGIRFA